MRTGRWQQARVVWHGWYDTCSHREVMQSQRLNTSTPGSRVCHWCLQSYCRAYTDIHFPFAVSCVSVRILIEKIIMPSSTVTWAMLSVIKQIKLVQVVLYTKIDNKNVVKHSCIYLRSKIGSFISVVVVWRKEKPTVILMLWINWRIKTKWPRHATERERERERETPRKFYLTRIVVQVQPKSNN